jgi:hypothetical protein
LRARREVSFAPWWRALRIEVYGGPARKPKEPTECWAAYNGERQAMVAVIPDSGKGAELTLNYSKEDERFDG